MEECVKWNDTETASSVKRGKLTKLMIWMLAGSLAMLTADQGMSALGRPVLLRWDPLRKEQEAMEQAYENKAEPLYGMEKSDARKEAVFRETSGALEDAEGAVQWETRIDREFFREEEDSVIVVPNASTAGSLSREEWKLDPLTSNEVGLDGAGGKPEKFPTAKLPTTDRPVADYPSADRPTFDRPAADLPITDRPVTESPTADRPTFDRPAADSLMEDRPAVEPPTTDCPVVESPSADGNGGSLQEETEEKTDTVEKNDTVDPNGTKDPVSDETTNQEANDESAENPTLPESAWQLDESGMLCQINPELLEMEEGVLELPDGMFTGIRKGAFSGISGGVYEVVLPSALTVIEGGTLAELTELEWIEAEGCAAFVSEDGVLFDAERKEILAFPSGKTGAYIVPPTVERIAENAFENSRLERLDLWECGRVEMDARIFGTGNGNGMTIAVPEDNLAYYEEIFAGCGVELI